MVDGLRATDSALSFLRFQAQSAKRRVALPNQALQTAVVLAYARNHAAESQGRWADGRGSILDFDSRAAHVVVSCV